MKRYIRQSVMKAPNGLRVRSIKRGAHVLRVAFPKGARTGEGKLVSIIHPRTENPHLCKMRKNPGLELVVLGANPGKKRNKNPQGTAGGESAQLYREFHGADPSEIIEVQESGRERAELVALGTLQSISGATSNGTFALQSDDIALASNPEGTQLYLVGGDQSGVMGGLKQLPGVDTSKDLIEIGSAQKIIYRTRKEMHEFREIDYVHEFAEEGGEYPTLFFDKLKRRLFLIGGSYTVKAEGIRN